MVPAVVSVAS